MTVQPSVREIIADMLDSGTPQEIVAAIVTILDMRADGNRGKPAGTIARINADVLRHALGKMFH